VWDVFLKYLTEEEEEEEEDDMRLFENIWKMFSYKIQIQQVDFCGQFLPFLRQKSFNSARHMG